MSELLRPRIASVAVVIPAFNPDAGFLDGITRLLNQSVSSDIRYRVIVIDDHSLPAVTESLPEHIRKQILLVRNDANRGRARTLNRGGEVSESDLLIFVDADCVANDDRLVQCHIDAVEGGADISIGRVFVEGHDFWARLQTQVHNARHESLGNGRMLRGTTANLAVRREAFEHVGGFDEEFQRYGFEDMEFLVRARDFKLAWSYTPDAIVCHTDRLSLQSVTRKFHEMGRFGSALMRRKQPKIYRRGPYAKLDAVEHSWLRAVDCLCWPLVRWPGIQAETWLECNVIPFRLKVTFVRIIYGLHYLHGTCDAQR